MSGPKRPATLCETRGDGGGGGGATVTKATHVVCLPVETEWRRLLGRSSSPTRC